MKRRAKRQEETRRRIVEATVEMHESVGMARTTISAIAEKAGVQRLTVYRHFPDERALFTACRGHWLAANPPMMANLVRDAQVMPLVLEIAQPYLQHWERMRYVLATGWGVADERLALLLAALGHALDFQTWRSLVRQQGLGDEQAVEVIVRMVRCTIRD
jgi:AcrR family transcriptional regulator